MSLAGPVLSIQPVVSQHTPHTLTPMATPLSIDLESSSNDLLGIPARRDRANSEGDVHAASQIIALPPSPLAIYGESSLSSSSSTQSPSINRSRSMPRGEQGVSQSLNGFLTPNSNRRPAQSQRFMRRAETIDTHNIHREEFEDHTLLNQYKVLDIIGHGSYGIVRKAMSMDNEETYAMKIVAKGRLKKKGQLCRPQKKRVVKSPLDNIKRETAILKKLNHPNVVRLLEVLDDPSEDDFILVFEFVPKGPVINNLPMHELFTEEQGRNYFIDMILGLEYLHSQHVIHRDIKPMNLLLDDNFRVKIADFGVSEEIERTESNLSRYAGTPAFVAPECLDGSKMSYQGQPVDIWAAGVTLYCFILGKVPWSPPSIVDLHEQIKTEDPPLPDSLPDDLKDLLQKLLEKDQKKRITIPQIREHPWILKSTRPVPSREENCNVEISVSEEDMEQAFKTYRTPIHILAMIKQMARKKSLRHPFSPRTTPTSSPATSPGTSPRHSLDEENATKSSIPHKVQGSLRKREKFASTHNAPPIVVDNADAARSQ
ncbi:calcium/calmodulin-dependent protein kinase kinase 1-like [Halichondria panicea]|uniref:calcium/calmodulin-dependent protein kinase kinase 1-like n=1 Tax=Halichondria panicea TaxID=6063 RepID=UPI00312B8FBB